MCWCTDCGAWGFRELRGAQATTIRLRLLKIAARIRITARKVWIWLASSFPLQTIFAHGWGQLRS
jgi:hypothetical protein